jgi:GNAT superfamily N-acetyltransferase
VVKQLVCSHQEFEIDDSLHRINFGAVHAWLTTTYWSPGISREKVERGTHNSTMVVGAYVQSSGKQAGFLRIISDTTRFGYICDVFVDPEHRGKGIASAMVRFAINHPDLADVTRWILATRDAHEVYRSVGFEPLPEPSRWMQYCPNRDSADRQAC